MDKRGFYFLFGGLLVLLGAEPFLAGEPRSDRLIQLAFALLVVVGSLGFHGAGWAFPAGLALAAVSLASAIGFYATDLVALEVLDLASVAAFCALAIGVLGRGVVLASGPVTMNRIFGALSVYLLLGVLWSALFGIVDVVAAGSFQLAGPESKQPLENLLYYSFVTLTTVGYGDVTPLHGVAKTLAYLEGVVGQLFLAVLIASLIGRRSADLQAGKLRAGESGETSDPPAR